MTGASCICARHSPQSPTAVVAGSPHSWPPTSFQHRSGAGTDGEPCIARSTPRHIASACSGVQSGRAITGYGLTEAFGIA